MVWARADDARYVVTMDITIHDAWDPLEASDAARTALHDAHHVLVESYRVVDVRPAAQSEGTDTHKGEGEG